MSRSPFSSNPTCAPLQAFPTGLFGRDSLASVKLSQALSDTSIQLFDFMAAHFIELKE